MTTDKAIEAAQAMTKRAATVKDWRIRNKRAALFRGAAREWAKNRCGYMLTSPYLLAKSYPELVNPNMEAKCHEVFIWGIDFDKKFGYSFVPVI